ncbi:MAG: HEAT repeat domain-containing protein [Kofleriaceae bacterium]
MRAGKVVAYCSAEHAKEAETRPTAIPAVPATARTPSAGVPKIHLPLDSGPVIEIIHEPSSGVVTSAPDTRKPRKDATPVPKKPSVDVTSEASKSRDDTLQRWSVDDGDAIPDPDRSGVRIADFEERRQRELSQPVREKGAGRLLVIVAIGLVLSAGAYGVYRFVLVKPEAAPVQTPPVIRDAPAEEPVDAMAMATPNPRAAVAQAEQVLRQHLASESPRVQQVAAAALARTRDPAAIEHLVNAIAKETVEVQKLELAYAVTRGGDDRGRVTLAASLGSGRRDVKLAAGSRLAQLGDERAKPVLQGYLQVSQHRLGAAEQLAYLRDDKALAILDTIRGDAKTSRDEHARATIALGIAGRRDVIPDLQLLLKDSHFNAFAASALAYMGDPTARAVLAEQLAVPSLRVEAARALRRLDPELDPAPLLADLVDALGSSKHTTTRDTDQVKTAEAILLLAGDLAWSERP